jgi:hypothetical protein
MSEVYTHQIEVFTADLAITGAYDLMLYRRVSDAINGDQRRYIPLRNATIGPLSRQGQVQNIPTMLFDRSEAVIVTALAEAEPPAEYPREEQIRDALPLTAMFFTQAFAVRGTFYRRPNHSLTEALERLSDDFLPLRRAQIFTINGSMASIERDFAALARTRIVALYQVADPVDDLPARGAADAM